MGQPIWAPMRPASAIMSRVKRPTRGSSRMRSQVAPVRADMGFIVMLPSSLYQISRCVLHQPGFLHLPASVHDAAYHPGGGDSRCYDPVRIYSVQGLVFTGPAEAVEEPPRDAVHSGYDYRLLA